MLCAIHAVFVYVPVIWYSKAVNKLDIKRPNTIVSKPIAITLIHVLVISHEFKSGTISNQSLRGAINTHVNVILPVISPLEVHDNPRSLRDIPM